MSLERPVLPRFSLEAFTPKSIICLREGYGKAFFLQDLLAGITVGIIALPLAMAFAIGSGPGIRPEQGLYTAIIAGFIIAVLGGSRVSVAGPTGAFMPILYMIVAKHGYSGLAIATIMAGIILIIMGLMKLGSLIKFIPYPVTTGFTSGIAVIIFSQQIKDLLGLNIAKVPPEFIAKWIEYVKAIQEHGINYATAAIAAGSLLLMILMRRFLPRIPGAIVAVVLSAAVVAIFDMGKQYGVVTIESAFPPGLPQTPPMPIMPDLSWASLSSFAGQAHDLMGDAIAIAMLGAIESLLCCVVSDGMIGGRHKSNLELIAQGIGNIASIAFGGIPATGAIARTAANVKSGGRTPLAGMIHAVFVLAAMLLLAPYAGKIPLAALASILVIVAWNMSEFDHFRHLFKAPRSDIIVLLLTFGLTVFKDLTIAVGVGMVLACLLFMRRMSEVTNVGDLTVGLENSLDDAPAGKDILTDAGDPNSLGKRNIPRGVEVFEINGPFFFGVADRLKDTLRGLERPPRVFILRMRRVPAIDASGLHALDEFYQKCHRQGTLLLLAGVHAQPMFALTQYGLIDKVGEGNMFGNIDDALGHARGILGMAAVNAPEHEPEVAREKPTAMSDEE